MRAVLFAAVDVSCGHSNISFPKVKLLIWRWWYFATKAIKGYQMLYVIKAIGFGLTTRFEASTLLNQLSLADTNARTAQSRGLYPASLDFLPQANDTSNHQLTLLTWAAWSRRSRKLCVSCLFFILCLSVNSDLREWDERTERATCVERTPFSEFSNYFEHQLLEGL